MIDANQVWEVDQAIDWMQRAGLRQAVVHRGADQPRRHRGPPPDPRGDRAGARSRPARCARTASCSSSSSCAGAIDVVQIDACRLGGVNEVLRGAADGGEIRSAGVSACRRRRPVRICPAPVDDRLSRASPGTKEGRVIEYVDHLHEHFVDPCVIRERRLHAAEAAGLFDRDEAGIDQGECVCKGYSA